MRKLTGNAAILAAAIAASAMVSSPSYADAKKATLMLAGYTGTTTLTNFQALVKLKEGRFGFSYDDYAAKDGSDLWFTDSFGNVIPHEIDTWNASGDSFVWVRVPEVSGTETKIVMHWGEAKTAAQTATENVWKNYGDGKGGFAGVWHMNVNLGDEPDVTGNGLSAARKGGNTGQMTVNADAVVGTSRVNQTKNSSAGDGNSLKVSGYGDYITDAAHFTLCGWFRASATPNAWFRIFHCSGKWDVYHNSNTYDAVSIGRAILIGSTNIADPVPDKLPSSENFVGNWCYVVVVFDGTSYRLYGNGRVLGSWTGKPSVDGFADYFLIGNTDGNNRGWYGRYDEVRLYDGAQSEDRVKADYATMNAPESFITVFGTPTAEWTGAGNDGDVTNPANWNYKDASGVSRPGTLPNSETVVTIAGNNLFMAASTNVSFSSCETRVGDCTLGADCDLRGLGDIVFTGTKVDMNGHTLKIQSFTGVSTITNSFAGAAADLYVYAAPGVTNDNTSVIISGNLRLVKEGRGGFFTSKEYQYYTGGTLVKDGALRCGAYGTRSPFGTGSITVDPDGIFDMNGWVGYIANEFVLNGGTLQNTRAQVSSGWALWTVIRLTADSTMQLDYSYGIRTNASAATTLDLGGHALTVRLANSGTHLQLYSTAILNGSIIDNVSAGYIHTYNAQADIGSESFDLNTGIALNLERDMVVRNYTAQNKWTTSNAGNASIKVHGTFKPMAQAENCFHGCIMQADSTIDLSNLTDALPLVSRFTNGANTLQFLDNTTVNIKLGARTVSPRKPIISWEPASKPTNIDTVNFVSVTGEIERTFVARNDGLYALSGLMIIVK